MTSGSEHFRTWAGAFLGAALFIILDPLGLSDGADRLSERIALGIAAPLLSLVEPGRQQDNADHAPDTEDAPRPGAAVTVFLVDDAFMAALPRAADGSRPGWPLPRDQQMDLLFAPLLDMAPDALFVDWVIHAPGPDNDATRLGARLAAFMAERGWADGSGPLLLFADRPAAADRATRHGQALRWTDADLLAQSSQAAAGLVPLFDAPFAARVATRWYGRADRYPLAPLALAPPGLLPADDPFRAGDRAIASPALALFARWCATAANAAANEACPVLGQPPVRQAGYVAAKVDAQSAAALSTLSAPQWLALQEPGMRLLRANAAPDHPCMAREARGVWGGLYDALRLRRAAAEEEVPFNPCFAITTLSARDLGTTGAPGLSGPALARLVEGRLVLIGVDLDSAPDRTDSPVNGSAPAVLLHATALENLVNSGGDRAREPPARRPLGSQAGLVLALLLAAFAAIPVTAIAEQRIAALAAQRDRTWQAMGMVGLALLAAPLAGLFLGPWALAAGAVGGAFLFLGAVRLAPGLLAGTGLLAALAGGLLLPLTLALSVYFVTNWAPANWISGLTAKLFMLGGATSAVSTFLGKRPGHAVHRLCNWLGRPLVQQLADRRWTRLLLGAGLVILLVLAGIWVKEAEPGADFALWLSVVAIGLLGLFVWLVAGWPGPVLLLAMAVLVGSAALTGWYPDEGLLLAGGWLATLALFPLMILWAPANSAGKISE